jgi:N-acetylglucosaminyl-diphospho-decaprenol L-rhamnosyltransferase
VLQATYMTLSIIIVNYNVKFFLEQCLCSVKKAVADIDAEIFVVDNNSVDASVEYLKPEFSFVKFISNKNNPGFGKANNQALAEAKGKYILFLNPDTIIGEDTFHTCIQFFEKNPSAGAVGVYMIDGSGAYLKESKRGFTSPWVSFCKLTGLTAFFPHSKLFAGYYLGHQDETKNNEVDILSGAFMMARKEVLDTTGGFDEQFFMYGEDIDLSYRIQKAGYKNYSVADTKIIHFKGESTVKDIRYTKLFYKAMSQFSRKHFAGGFSAVFRALMNIAIWFRGIISAIGNLFRRKKIKSSTTTEEIRTFFMGDENEITHLKNSAALQQRIFTDKQQEATEIIFCEGINLSFQQIISLYKGKNEKVSYKIHAANSKSIVGSGSKEMMGETISL